MGRMGGTKTQVVLILSALALVAWLVVLRVRAGSHTQAGTAGVVVSAAVSLALVTLALVVGWRSSRRR